MASQQPTLSLSVLLSSDNSLRRTAEAEFERLKADDPALVAVSLVAAMTPSNDEAERSMAA
eukprot:397813-Prymnesium_polylepis.1